MDEGDSVGGAPVGFRSEPNPEVSSAKAAEVGKDFVKADKQAGWLVVNKWTYRLLRAAGGKFLPKFDDSQVEITEVAAPAGVVQLVRPKAVTGDGAIMLIHGGGFVLGSNKEVLIHAAMFATNCGVPVFCPGYRLAPEHPCPAGLDDCHSAWKWLVDNAATHGVDPQKIIVAGISAGGGHAASLAQRLYDEGGTQPAAQLLFYPMLDDRTAANRSLDKPRHRVWSNRNNLFGWASYLGRQPGGECPDYAAAARRQDLTGLPPAWIGIGGADLFLDESREYAKRLREAGSDVTYVEIDGGIHGFDLAQESPLTKAFYASASEFAHRFSH